VSAVSASDVWAVGQYYNAGAFQTLIVHWDGTAWTQVPSPNAPGSTQDNLVAVRATSATNAWAVGSYHNSSDVSQTLILHWNGTTWTQVASPSPAQSSSLTSVAATSAGDAWAVGFYYTGTADQSMILHWDGASWTQVTSPSPGSLSTILSGVRATSPSNAWAVGSYTSGTPDRTLILHWNGSAWKQVTTPNPGGAAHDNDLSSIAATSANDAWAAGAYDTGTGLRTVALHWDGVGLDAGDNARPGQLNDRHGPQRGRRQLGWQRLGGGQLLQRHRETDPRHPLLLTSPHRRSHRSLAGLRPCQAGYFRCRSR
jgi:hypothetical protein